MVLPRSNSTQSTWDLHLASDDQDDVVPDQRRVRHLSAVLVRNLSLDPRRDGLSAALAASSYASHPRPPTSAAHRVRFPSSHQEQADAPPKDLLQSLQRRRAGSTASWNGLPEQQQRDGEELVLGASSDAAKTVRTRPRRSSSAGTLLAHPAAIAEEPAPPTDERGAGRSSVPLRQRSTSRASVASAGSSSTIRQAPRLPPSLPVPQQQKERPPPPSSSQFAQREKQRREEALRRRLVDSFVTLELVPPPVAADAAAPSGRRRSGTVGSSRMRRSDSGSSLNGFPSSDASPRKGMRRRTTSSSVVSLAKSALPTSAPAPSEPFFISPPSLASMHASFPVEHDAFLFSPSFSASASAAGADLPGDSGLRSWPGLRESRIRARVFARESDEMRAPSASVDERSQRGGTGTGTGKGKGKEAEDDERWKVLVEWDVELSGLTSLGRDPTAFPTLPPNTLIFALSSTPASSPFASSSSSSAAPVDLEYVTAPLPLLQRSYRRTRHRPIAPASRGLANGRARALSEDEAGFGSDSDCSSCASLDGSDGAAEDDGQGNVSDPGQRPSRVRARRGTLVRPRGQQQQRSAAAVVEAERARRKATREEVLERSRRETRMGRAADWEGVRRVWEMEWEVERARKERDALSDGVREAMDEGGERSAGSGWAELQRERAELQDRVDDLLAVKGAVDGEYAEDQERLDTRRDALRARRARLEQARELDDANRGVLQQKQDELAVRHRTYDQLVSSSRIRRTQLITLLSHIFPIEPVDPPPSSKTPAHLLFSIVGLPLPNSSFPPSFSDDLLSSALGFAAQVTQLLAAYLSVPLCYPIQCRGSRSVIVDEISMMKGPRAFPLWGKGVDRYRFDYAVFLLNKNIEQLMYSQGLTVLDLRNTLPNLKSLILSLSYDPSHSDYRASTLLPTGVFADSASPQRESSAPPALNGHANEEDDDEDAELARLAAASPPPPVSPDVDANGAESTSPQSTRMSRSPSLASTIRASSLDRARAGEGGRSRSGADEGSPTPTVRSVDGDDRVRSANSANAAVEKRVPPASAQLPSLASAPTQPLKTRPAASAAASGSDKARARAGSSASASAGAGAAGYGARIREGLWSAVAGNVASGERGMAGARARAVGRRENERDEGA